VRNAPTMSSCLFTPEIRPGWLIVTFSTPQRIASWSLNRPGLTIADQVAWLEVVDADLPLGVDPLALLTDRLAAAGLSGAVGLMTARKLDRYQQTGSGTGLDRAEVLLTLGLTNGAVLDPTGQPHPVRPPPGPVGTINLFCWWRWPSLSVKGPCWRPWPWPLRPGRRLCWPKVVGSSGPGPIASF